MMAEKLAALQAPLYLVAAVLAAKWAMHANRGRLTAWNGRWKVRRTLTRLCLDRMDDVRLGSGPLVEHVVRLPGCILAIATRERAHPGTRPDTAHVEAIEAATKGAVRVEGLIVVVGEARPDRFRPRGEGGVPADDVADRLLAIKALHPPDSRVTPAWLRLKKVAERQERAGIPRKRPASDRVPG